MRDSQLTSKAIAQHKAYEDCPTALRSGNLFRRADLPDAVFVEDPA
jgi:hypothetical protein